MEATEELISALEQNTAANKAAAKATSDLANALRASKDEEDARKRSQQPEGTEKLKG